MATAELAAARARLEALVSAKLGAPRRTRPDEILIGLVGRGIQSSRTPAMHEMEGARLGLTYAYVLIDFDALGLADAELPAVLALAELLGFVGLNVTHPFKQAVLAHLDALSPEAAGIGAVNTVLLRHGRRMGDNTDSWGFAESFRVAMPDAAVARVVLAGAGGAGGAVGRALMSLGVGHLTIRDTDMSRSAALAQRLAGQFPTRTVVASMAEAALDAADGLVNATPVGMEKYPGLPFPAERLRPPQWVADIVYFPPETALLRRAAQIGCRVLPGTGMAVFQAVKAFELFSSAAPDRAAMLTHFETAGAGRL